MLCFQISERVARELQQILLAEEGVVLSNFLLPEKSLRWLMCAVDFLCNPLIHPAVLRF
jgi:hypothetical protein